MRGLSYLTQTPYPSSVAAAAGRCRFGPAHSVRVIGVIGGKRRRVHMQGVAATVAVVDSRTQGATPGPSFDHLFTHVSASFDLHHNAAIRCTSGPASTSAAMALFDAQKRLLLEKIKALEVV